VDTSPRYPLGFTLIQPALPTNGSTYPDAGEREWIYVFNDEAATAFAQGTVVARDAGSIYYDGIVAPLSCHSARVIGVAQHAIAAGSYGFILRRGLGEVIADTGGLSADTGLICGNAVAGTADDGGATVATFGVTTEAALATALATCFINCRG
jgi:hypothetical protein